VVLNSQNNALGLHIVNKRLGDARVSKGSDHQHAGGRFFHTKEGSIAGYGSAD